MNIKDNSSSTAHRIGIFMVSRTGTKYVTGFVVAFLILHLLWYRDDDDDYVVDGTTDYYLSNDDHDEIPPLFGDGVYNNNNNNNDGRQGSSSYAASGGFDPDQDRRGAVDGATPPLETFHHQQQQPPPMEHETSFQQEQPFDENTRHDFPEINRVGEIPVEEPMLRGTTTTEHPPPPQQEQNNAVSEERSFDFENGGASDAALPTTTTDAVLSDETTTASPHEEAVVTSGSVQTIPARDENPATEMQTIEYLHCGPFFGRVTPTDDPQREVLLLHGARFTKEEWRSSGLLEQICKQERGAVSVTAVDLDTNSDAMILRRVILGLAAEGIVSGRPLFFVTPSASGKVVVSAAENDVRSGVDGGPHDETLLGQLVRGWIPIGIGWMTITSEEVIQRLNSIPILTIHGSRDNPGKKLNKRLKESAGANVLEIEGDNMCFFDSPDLFVEHLLNFVNQHLN